MTTERDASSEHGSPIDGKIDGGISHRVVKLVERCDLDGHDPSDWTIALMDDAMRIDVARLASDGHLGENVSASSRITRMTRRRSERHRSARRLTGRHTDFDKHADEI